MNPSTSNSYLYKKLTSFTCPWLLLLLEINCACLRIHKHPDIKNAFDCASSQSYIPQILANLAIVKNSRLSRYRSPAIISFAHVHIDSKWQIKNEKILSHTIQRKKHFLLYWQTNSHLMQFCITCVTFSCPTRSKTKADHVLLACLAVFCISYTCLVHVFVVSLDCLCPIRLTEVITQIWFHNREKTRSDYPEKENFILWASENRSSVAMWASEVLSFLCIWGRNISAW